jgi:hypothetical protein
MLFFIPWRGGAARPMGSSCAAPRSRSRADGSAPWLADAASRRHRPRSSSLLERPPPTGFAKKNSGDAVSRACGKQKPMQAISLPRRRPAVGIDPLAPRCSSVRPPGFTKKNSGDAASRARRKRKPTQADALSDADSMYWRFFGSAGTARATGSSTTDRGICSADVVST